MSAKKWIKKSMGVFICATILVNTVVPIFAHSQIDSENYISKQPENIKVCVSEETSDDKLMEIDLNGQKISSHLIGKDDAAYSDETSHSKQLNKDQTVQLDDVLTDVSVRYKMKEQKLKEDFILHSKESQNSFVLQYNIGDLHAEQINTQDILLLDKNGRAKMLISAPYMTDSAGARSEAVSLQISGEKEGVLSVNLTADSSWLQDDKRSYPIEVDPLYSLPKDTLRKGDSNKDVAVLKSMLLEAGLGAGISKHEVMSDMRSELFGPITERFVRTFQLANGLNVTGIADIRTLDVLAKCLERKKILDTQEHIDQFLKRVESRSSPETGEQVKGVASYFRRINFTDLAVTVGITGVATVVGAACFPLIGVAGILAVGAAVGATANGVSEYAQQREVGESVDMSRVGIKALGGAVKGGVSAIPGVSMYKAFSKAVNVAGQTLGPVLSTAVGDAVGEAAVTAATNALTPTVVCHAMGAAGNVLAHAAAGDVLMAAGGALGVGAAEGIGCAVQSGKTVKEATKDAVLNGACQAAVVPVAAAVVVGGAACGAVCVAYNKKDPQPDPNPNPNPIPNPIPQPNPQPNPVQDSSRHTKEKTTERMKQTVVQEEKPIIPDAKTTKLRTGTDAKDSQHPQTAEAVQKRTITEKAVLSERQKLEQTVQEIYSTFRANPDEANRIVRDLYAEEQKKYTKILRSAEKGEYEITPETQKALELVEMQNATLKQRRDLCERAKCGDTLSHRRVQEESRIELEQLIRYQEMIGKRFFDRLANKYK